MSITRCSRSSASPAKVFDFILALVELAGEHEHRVRYLRQSFRREPDFGVRSVNDQLAELLARAGEPS
ncbi:MAG TPA: hypothetical protein VG963_33010 [Polyangiaceae bacterium]|nr:hypothetical protein [Polyangiaceae bacterium]